MSKIIYFVVWLFLIVPAINKFSSPLLNCEISNVHNNTIDCSSRNLPYIPIDEINQLNASSVQVLDISNNNLRLSSEDVSPLYNYLYRSTLLKLLLNDNLIENLPDLSDVFPNLTEINLLHNNITYLTAKQFLRYESLKKLCLDSNPLNDTVLENLKRRLSHINFTCSDNSNDIVSTTPVEDDVTTLNTKENAKTTKSPNLESKVNLTTKSGSLLTTPANGIDNNSSKPTEKNSIPWLLLIGCIVIVVAVPLYFICPVICYFYQNTRNKMNLNKTENQENSRSANEPLVEVEINH